VLAGAINTVVLVPLLNPKAGFSARHVRPLAKVGSTEVVLVAAADFPASNLVELGELARVRGTALSAGHPGNETVQALALAMLGKRTTPRLVPVPYNGAARLVTDLLGGHLDVAVVAMPVAAPLLKQGRLKVLERLSKRNGFDLDSWSGWFVPAAAPAGATRELTDALLAAMDDEDVQRALLMLGAPAPPWPEQRRFARDIQRTALAYAELVRQTGHTGN
jgi:tripartite-type tricarboxylate transporter receptor subunit TctC